MTAREMAEALDARRLEVLEYLLPAGKVVGGEYRVGSIAGEAGKSLKVALKGSKALWQDFASDGKGGGDLLALWSRAKCGGDVGQAMREAAEWLGLPPPAGKVHELRAAPKAAAPKRAAGKPGEIPKAHPTLGRPSATWIYRSATGEPIAAVMRFETPEGKDYRPYDLRTGAWTMTPPRPLYGLCELAEAPGAPVVIVEGEKCTDALAGCGILATTTMGGALAVDKADLSPLAGRPIYLWRDADEPGEKWLEALTARLQELPGVDLYIVPIPPGVREKWDVADAIEDGWTAEQVREWIGQAERIPPPPRRLISYSVEDYVALDLPPTEYVLAPWIVTQGSAMVYSWRGVGKSFFALNVAYAIASGGEFLRWKAPKPRRVLYLDGELRPQDMQVRLRDIVKMHARRAEPGYLQIVSSMLQPNGMPYLSTAEGRAAVEEYVADGIELVVIDNLATLYVGAENEAEAWVPMQEWILRFRRMGVAVLFIHHAGKSGAQRGHSTREDIVETTVALREPKDKRPNDPARFEVHFEKRRGFHGKDAEPFEACFETNQHGEPCWTIRTLEDATYQSAVEMLASGMKPAEAAKDLGVHLSTVYRHQKRAKQDGKL